MGALAGGFEQDLPQLSKILAQLEPMHSVAHRDEVYREARMSPSSQPPHAVERVNEAGDAIAEVEARICMLHDARFRQWSGARIGGIAESDELARDRCHTENLTTLFYMQDDDEFSCEDPNAAIFSVANGVAVSVILRATLTPTVTEGLLQHIPGLTFCSLALLADNNGQQDLIAVPVLGTDHSLQSSLSGRYAGHSTAAWASFASRQTIVWHSDDVSCYSDWRVLLESYKHKLESIVTVPLQAPGTPPIGAASFAFAAPRAVDLSCLEHFAFLLCQAICHNTKHLWEVSLAFLIQVLPPKLLRRMLSNSTRSLGGSIRNSSVTTQMAPETPREHHSKASSALCTPLSEDGELEEGESNGDGADVVAAVLAATAGLYNGVPHQAKNTIERSALPPSTFSPLSLEFEDPALEASFRVWFTASQCEVDRQLSLVYALMLVLMGFAIWIKGAAGTIAALLTLQIGLGALVLPGVFQFGWGAWYAVHRASVVITLRLTGTALVLAHWCTSPQYYAGSLTKAILGRAVGRLALCSVRQKLPFAAHLMSMMGELYLCALFNSFAFLRGRRETDGGPGLLWTSLTQLAAALANAVATYYLERRTRAMFLERGGAHS